MIWISAASKTYRSMGVNPTQSYIAADVRRSSPKLLMDVFETNGGASFWHFRASKKLD